MASYLHVAVGVLRRKDGKVLLARRRADAHQGGLWEFPGGKVEAGETVQNALKRELLEELAIIPLACEPLIQVRHHYPDLSVLLDVWEVTDFQGQPQGNEGQPIAWVEPKQLDSEAYPLPAANAAIVKAITLPQQLLITGEFDSPDDFLSRLQGALERGAGLVQVRSLNSMSRLTPAQRQNLAQRALTVCQRFNATLVLNSNLGLSLEGAGLHLTAAAAHQYNERPPVGGMLGISCHNEDELAHAARLNADYALLSPVAKTESHPGARALGWGEFERLVASVNCPVFALGGMNAGDVVEARRRGAQGIAAITALWG